jgi:hypothetical protein
MTIRTPEMQTLIDREYAKLEAFDPEIRHGLIERHFHSKEQREDIKRRMDLYNAECLKFRDFCEKIVVDIVTPQQESRMIPDYQYNREKLAA